MQTEHPLRFHWSAHPGDQVYDQATFFRMSLDAETAGVESLRVPIAADLSDALNLAVVVGRETTRVKFRVGGDFAEILRSLSGRELKEAWETLGARLIVHMSFESENHPQTDRFLAAGEFIANCRKLFEGSQPPQFEVEGDSSETAFLAIKYADTFWRSPDRPNQVYADALPVLHFGKEVGLVCCVIARETQEDALLSAAELLSGYSVEQLSNPESWITPQLLKEVAPDGGENKVILGSFEQVARTIHGFNKSGISQFMVRELPGQRELAHFAERALPIIRAIESGK